MKLVAPSYVPLRIHSAYSLLEGAITIPKLVSQAKASQFRALALTDSGNLFGAMEFSLACAAAGIQPILGCQITLHPDSFQEKGLRKPSKQEAPLSLLLVAQHEGGYRNLIKLVSRTSVGQESHLSGTLSLSNLEDLSEGLICLSGGMHGPLNQALVKGDTSEAKKLAQLFQNLFPNRFYVELSRYGGQEQRIEPQLLELAETLHLPLVATNEAFFLSPDLHEAHDALLCIADGTYVNTTDRRRVTAQHYLKTSQEMETLFQDIPEALLNTVLIACQCSFLLKPQKPMLPSSPTSGGRTEADELRLKAEEGLKHRLETHVLMPHMEQAEREARQKLYQERLAYETDMIIQMGFAGYFLIVADFIQWAKSQSIPVGPGRGSGASSLVAWVLTITDVDPIRFNLLFERFLNPERVSMPDFDVDFCQERRDEVIAYVAQKYGADKVAHIITFGKLQARAVLRDVGRVLQMPYTQVDRICKLIPNNPTHPVTLDEAISKDPQLQEMETDPQVKQLLHLGRQLEGLYRHASTHAAGVVIGGEPLENLVPLYQDPRSKMPATQFNMKYVEQAGLVKFDFLGLKTLTVMQHTVNLLQQRGITVNLSEIPLDDVPTFSLLNRVEAVGVFQVESGGMRDVLRKLRPERFEELIALVALYRPGPMDDIPRYLACRHAEEKVHYPYPCLESILEETFGVMVYQEQVLQIARTLAGYSLGSADLLRRAMGKKIKAEMQAQGQAFVEGVLATHGGTKAQASQLFEQIAKFAGYAFPKAHAAPYALLLYQTAYLKANYPVEFMAASLTLDFQNTDKLTVFAREVLRMNLPLLPPDVNISDPFFTVETLEDGRLGIRYALAALKNVGQAAMESVIAEREAKGPFKDIYDFMERVDTRAVNKRQLEGLIAAGCFDTLHTNRRQLFNNVDLLLGHSAAYTPTSLFDLHETRAPLPPTPDWPPLEKLGHEFQAIGFYLTAHPLEAYQDCFQHLKWVSSHELQAFLEHSQGREGRTFSMMGVLLTKQERISKSGQKYAFLQLSDPTGVYEVVLFSEALGQYRALLEPGTALLLTVSGRLDGESTRLTCNQLETCDAYLSKHMESVTLTLASEHALQGLAGKISQLASGNTLIYLKFRLPQVVLTFKLSKPYQLTGGLKAELQALAEAGD
jgi:DNA polymerase III subunit alpha